MKNFKEIGVCLPSSTSEPGQNQFLLLFGHLHDAGNFQSLTNPITLFQRIDEHKLHTNMPGNYTD